MPTISIVMPTFNRLPLVADAVDSVLAQEGVDFELLIVDDCSKDGSFDFLAEKYSGHPRIRLLQTQVNSGPAVAKNQGIQEASAPLVTILCDDDALRAGALNAAVSMMNLHPDIGFGWFGYCVYIDNFEPTSLKKCGIRRVPLLEDPAERELAWAVTSPGDGHCVVMRRSLVLEAGSYRPQFRAAEDTDLLLRLMRRHDYSYDARPMVNIRRHHMGQTMHDAQLRVQTTAQLLISHEGALQHAPHAKARWKGRLAGWCYASGDSRRGRRLYFQALWAYPTSASLWKSWAKSEKRVMARFRPHA